MKYLPNIFTNEFVNAFDKNNNPIFYRDECIYINNINNIIKFNYIGNDEYILIDSNDHIKYKLSSLSGKPDTSKILNNDFINYAYYVLCIFDDNTDELVGIINISNDFDFIYNVYLNLEENESILNQIPINKIFINKKIYKVYADLGSS